MCPIKYVSFDCTSCVGGYQNSSVSQPSPNPVVVPSNKLAKIEPRQTAIAWIATNNSTGQTCVASVPKTQPSYLLLATSVGNSIVCQSPLKSPSNVDKPQTSGAAQIRKSRPSFVVVASSVGNSVGNFAAGSRQPRLKSPGGVGSPTSGSARMLSNTVVVVSRSSTSTSSLSYVAASSPFLTVSGSGGSGMVLQNTGVQSSAGVVATLLLPTAQLDRMVSDGSKPSSSVQYVLPAPAVQPMSLQSPSNSMLLGNSQLNFVQTSSSNCIPMGNLQAHPVRLSSSLGNTKLTVVELPSSGCLPVGNSQTFVVQSPLGNPPSAVVRQSSSNSLLVGNSHFSGIRGIPASTAIQPLLGNSQSNVVQQSQLYYVLMGNSQSSNIQVSLVNSTLPQIVLLGQTAAIHPQPQHSSSLVSASQ